MKKESSYFGLPEIISKSFIPVPRQIKIDGDEFLEFPKLKIARKLSHSFSNGTF